jgi:hypothetical protein
MKYQSVVFRFQSKPTMQQKERIMAEFEKMKKDVSDAMKKAEHKTTNSLQYSVFQEIRENLDKYIILEFRGNECKIKFDSETLRAFDVKLPVNGAQTTAEQLANRIGKTFIPGFTSLLVLSEAIKEEMR